MTALPTWLPEETWQAFMAMRKAIKKPPTEYAQKLLLRSLYKMRDEGYDPVGALEQSIINNWPGVFPPKDRSVAVQRSNGIESFATQDRRSAETRVSQATGGLLARRAKAQSLDEVFDAAPQALDRPLVYKVDAELWAELSAPVRRNSD